MIGYDSVNSTGGKRYLMISLIDGCVYIKNLELLEAVEWLNESKSRPANIQIPDIQPEISK